MKKIILSVFVLTISLGSMAQKTPVKLKATPAKVQAIVTTTASPAMKSLLDSFSYMAGYNVANNMLAQGITEVNSALLKKGLDDFFAKRTPLCSPQQGNTSLQRQLEIFAAKKRMQDSLKAVADKSVGVAFLANNKKRKEVISLPDGLQYEIIKQGEATAHKPTALDTVVVNYIGTLMNGTEFDNSYKRGQPAIFPVGQVIKGWTEILQMMQVGSHWKVYIPTELAYADNPPPGSGIAAGAPLVFDILLEGIKPVITK